MSRQGVGCGLDRRGWVGWGPWLRRGAGLLALGLAACATPESGARASADSNARVDVAASSEPEQVVQRMVPRDEGPADGEPRHAVPADGASKGTSPGAAEPGRGTAVADDTSRRSGAPITAQHLEAELNRLEAELQK
jgi:hypothetical protein